MSYENDELDHGWDTLQLSADEKIVVDKGMPVVITKQKKRHPTRHKSRHSHGSRSHLAPPEKVVTPNVNAVPIAGAEPPNLSPSGLAPPPIPAGATASAAVPPPVSNRTGLFGWVDSFTRGAQRLFAGDPNAPTYPATQAMPGAIPPTKLKTSPLVPQTSPYMQHGTLPPYDQQPLSSQFPPGQIPGGPPGGFGPGPAAPYSTYPGAQVPLTGAPPGALNSGMPPGSFGNSYTSPLASPQYASASQPYGGLYDRNYSDWIEAEQDRQIQRENRKRMGTGAYPAGFNFDDDLDYDYDYPDVVVGNQDFISAQAPLLVLAVAVFIFYMTRNRTPPAADSGVSQSLDGALASLQNAAIIGILITCIILFFKYFSTFSWYNYYNTPASVPVAGTRSLRERRRGPFDFHTSQPYDFMAQVGANSMPFGPGYSTYGTPGYGMAGPTMGVPGMQPGVQSGMPMGLSSGMTGMPGSIPGAMSGIPGGIDGLNHGMPGILRNFPGGAPVTNPGGVPGVTGGLPASAPVPGAVAPGNMPVGGMQDSISAMLGRNLPGGPAGLGGLGGYGAGQLHPNLYSQLNFEGLEDEYEDEEEPEYDYLPSGSFESKLVPSQYLKSKKKASSSHAPPAPTPFTIPGVPKEILEEEDKPNFYEPMPPLPGVDDPTIEPVLLKQLRQGPDEKLLKEVERKKGILLAPEHAVGKKDERIEGTSKKMEPFYIDAFACKPYGPPPRRYHGVNA